MKKFIVFFVCSIICMFVSSCDNGESKSKETVRAFCEAYNAQQTDKVALLYPDFTAGVAKASQIDLDKLKVSRENDIWKVDDGVNHIFYISKSGNDWVIKDSRNVIDLNSKTGGDVKAAEYLQMVTDNSTDIERLKAYSMLKDGSDFINFLKEKHPQAMVYNISLENVKKKKEGGYGIYWLEATATVKAGPTKPLGLINVDFIFKDKNGVEIVRKVSPAYPHKNSAEEIHESVDLSDYPNVTDVSAELKPSDVRHGASDIDVLYIYGNLDRNDYKEYIKSNK